MQQSLLIIGAAIFGCLGLLHLIYTFSGNKFEARDPAVTAAMKSSSPLISRDTSMWKAWIGFNASHSLGAMLVAGVYIPLAANHLSIIQQSLWFTVLPILVGVSYLLLAKRYWFNIPFIGISISTLCFVVAALL
jgi:hypothetical protein